MLAELSKICHPYIKLHEGFQKKKINHIHIHTRKFRILKKKANHNIILLKKNLNLRRSQNVYLEKVHFNEV